MTDDLMIILRSGGIAAALLVISVLLTLPRANRRANRCLALLLFILVLNLVHGFFSRSTIIEALPYLFMLGFPTYLGLGPLLYFYTRALTDPDWSFSRAQWVHFIPLLITWLLLIPLFLQPAEVKQQMVAFSQGSGRAQWGVIFFSYVPIVLSLIGYSAACLIRLQAHRTRILDEFSSIEQVNLNWLRGLAWFMILISLSVLLPVPEEAPRLYWFKVVSVALIFYVGHMGIRQPLIFHHRTDPADPQSDEHQTATLPPEKPLHDGQIDTTADSNRKYQSTGLDSEQAQQYWEQLQILMKTDQPYLAPDLSLAELAQKLAIQPAHLSQVINSCAHINFYDFINGYRIQAAKSLLLEGTSKWSILDIALEAGFNSKSTFYTQFKKHAGMTPTAFRRQP
jgi:AraC-like DNA-binding protein